MRFSNILVFFKILELQIFLKNISDLFLIYNVYITRKRYKLWAIFTEISLFEPFWAVSGGQKTGAWILNALDFDFVVRK